MNARNAYFILGVSPDATPGEIEREGRKLLGLLEVGSEAAREYVCAVGTFPRDETMVREAMAALRDPKHRAKERCLAKLADGAPASEEVVDGPFGEAFLAGGYRGL
jgi:hypothetical protein